MCLVPGLSDGKYLTSNEFLPEELATPSECACGCGPHLRDDRSARLSRRDLLAGSLAALGGLGLTGALVPQSANAQASITTASSSDDAVVFLGTGGGPVVTQPGAQPGAALRVSGTYYLVDAGADTLRQLYKAGVPLEAVRHLFITHNHSDHMAGYPTLVSLGWGQNAPLRRLDVWGPQQKQLHTGFEILFGPDIASREFVKGVTPLNQIVHSHDFTVPRGDNRIRSVFEDAKVRVTAVRVPHGSFAEMPYAYGYRFHIKHTGKSVVFGGDCSPNRNLVALAADCDLLIHEALFVPGVDAILQAVEPSLRAALRKHLLGTHTDVRDVPRVAKNARAKRVALTHYVPGFIPPAAFLSAAQSVAGSVGYAGELIAPHDLDVVAV